ARVERVAREPGRRRGRSRSTVLPDRRTGNRQDAPDGGNRGGGGTRRREGGVGAMLGGWRCAGVLAVDASAAALRPDDRFARGRLDATFDCATDVGTGAGVARRDFIAGELAAGDDAVGAAVERWIDLRSRALRDVRFDSGVPEAVVERFAAGVGA